MGYVRRTALAALLLATVSGGARAADPRPAADAAKTTSTTDRLKAKKKPPVASMDRQTATAPTPKPAAKAPKPAHRS